MTGYGRGEAVCNGRSLVAEVRSVNNRYLDCTVKLPRTYSFAEEALKNRVKEVTTRGKVEVFITMSQVSASDVVVKVNEPLAAGYVHALQELAEKLSLKDDISVSMLTHFPDVLLVEKAAEDTDQLTADLCSVLDLALARYDTMRSREGERLEQDILSRLDTLERSLAFVEERSPQTLAAYRERLWKKLSEVLESTQIDESRILTEAAIFADKIAVDEETVRLHSHIAQFRGMLQDGGPVGRKLDFLVQEMNRETNTIGSKCNDLEISNVVVDMKAEIEKIREQIQNLE
ncbi:MAG: YicC family protein [Oscillospiraceae bacterium]|nr:YicC family protein [Oscillospiraceae bacterium]